MNDNEGKEFAALGVKKWLIKQLFSLGIKSPTPIQKGCIQQILAGDDCIGAAKTGSGKTFAFALPILQNLLFSESFSDDLETIFNVLPAKRQNLLFSATISEEVRDSKILPLNKDVMSTLDQRYAVCPAYARDVYLVQALRKYRETTPSSHVLVFTDTKKECQEAQLDNEEFEVRKRNYRVKRWLQAGVDPDAMEAGDTQNPLQESGDIDASIKEGLKKVNKNLMKKDERFKDVIGKISKIKKKAEAVKQKGGGGGGCARGCGCGCGACACAGYTGIMVA
ncbi:hypothetical protein MSG28_009112 [Choristoneura fumiferana]|uniref:Uncharacterized protein n=1 Tax=Choristoneura fumiferana TaxID=7141 RepID=A0ACC0KWS7_CHOFU|nr:hypothetical protein MSG28_009112 [Choristoneura fumiferana]